MKTTKEKIAVMEAFESGEEIQIRNLPPFADRGWDDLGDVDNIIWNWLQLDYRIKPKPTLRPWKPEEVPVGALIRGSHHGVRVILGYGKTDNSSNFYVLYWGHCEMTGDGLEKCFKHREHSLDNGRTWRPCGVLEG